MEREFVRECWNKVVSPEDFYHKLNSDFDTEDYKKIVLSLLSLCGELGSANNLLYDYLSLVFEKATEKILDFVDINNIKHVNGCLSVFLLNGTSLFNSVAIGSVDSASAALKALEICLSIQDDQKAVTALSTLSRSQVFSILISSSRYFLPDRFKTTRSIFSSRNLFNKTQSPSLSLSLLISAVKKEVITPPRSALSKNDIIHLFSASMRFWTPNFDITNFLSQQIRNELYLLAMQGFINQPTIIGAHFCAHYLVMEYKLLVDSSWKETEPLNCEQIEKLLEALINYQDSPVLSTVLQPFNEALFEHGLNTKDIISIFSETPAIIIPSKLFKTILKYPMLSINLTQYLREKLLSGSLNDIYELCSQFNDNLYDFLFFCFQKGFISDITSMLYNQLSNIYSDEVFFEVWNLFISSIFFPWISGSMISRNQIMILIETFDEKINRFIKALLGIENYAESNSKYVKLISPSPIIRVWSFFEYLLSCRSDNIPYINEQLSKFPYLWIAVYSWGMHHKSPHIQAISSQKKPRKFLYDSMFDHMMIMIRKPDRLIHCVREHPNYDIIFRFIDEIAEDMRFVTVNLVFSSAKSRIWIIEEIHFLVISWRAWIRQSGVFSFIHSLFGMIKRNSMNRIDFVSSRFIFQSCAYFFSIACDENPDYLMDSVHAIKQYLESGFESPQEGEGIASFVMTVVLSITHDWIKRFDYVLEICESILNEGSPINSHRSVFALMIIRVSLYIPILQKKLPPNMVKILISNNEWSTAIDFFIVMSHKLMC